MYIRYILLIFVALLLFMNSCDTTDSGPEIGIGELAPVEAGKLENRLAPSSLHVGQNTDYTRFLLPLGTLKGLMVLVDFPNAKAEEPVNLIQNIDEYVQQNVFFANHFFQNASYNRFSIEIDMMPVWLPMPENDSYYRLARNDSQLRVGRYSTDALTMANNFKDLSDYDFYVIVPPSNADAIELSIANLSTVEISDSLSIRHVVIIGNEGGRDRDDLKLVHEFLHLAGLPDLYDGRGSRNFTGGFDMMSSTSSSKPDNFTWLKWKMGWIDDHQVRVINSKGITTHEISPSARSDDQFAKMVVILTSSRTAYVLENRIAEKNDVVNLRDQGLLVYSVYVEERTLGGPIWVIEPQMENNLFLNRTLSLEPGRVSDYINERLGVGISVQKMHENGNITVQVTKHP